MVIFLWVYETVDVGMLEWMGIIHGWVGQGGVCGSIFWVGKSAVNIIYGWDEVKFGWQILWVDECGWR